METDEDTRSSWQCFLYPHMHTHALSNSKKKKDCIILILKTQTFNGKFLSYFAVAVRERLRILETNRNLTMPNLASCFKVVSHQSQNNGVKKYSMNLILKIQMNLSSLLSVTNQFDAHLKRVG